MTPQHSRRREQLAMVSVTPPPAAVAEGVGDAAAGTEVTPQHSRRREQLARVSVTPPPGAVA